MNKVALFTSFLLVVCIYLLAITNEPVSKDVDLVDYKYYPKQCVEAAKNIMQGRSVSDQYATCGSKIVRELNLN